jgi:putative DNA primase/helicase
MTETTTTAKSKARQAVQPTGIDDELKTFCHWVVWRAAPKGVDKIDKVPYDPKTGKRASSTDSRTWASFSEALEALEASPDRYDGIGFVFSSGDPFVGIDLDNCRDPETGQLQEWAAAIVAAFEDAYKEISPSGRGVHIIALGKARQPRKGPGLEIYSAERFFTTTGRTL